MIINSGLITSIVRFTTFFQHNSFIDGTWTAVDLIIWTQIEPGIYLISACLMTYRPLLERISHNGLVGKLTRSSNTSRTAEPKDANDLTTSIPLRPKAGQNREGFFRFENDNGVYPDVADTDVC